MALRYGVYRMTRGKAVLAALALVVAGLALRGMGRAVTVSGPARQLPIYSVETDRKAVALGFNCAWDNADIPALIEVFRAQGVRATFFVSGSWCKKYPESVKALYDAGHEIGSHSNTHTDMTTLSRARLVEEITRCNDKIAAVTGKSPVLFRMPSGAYNDLVIETIKAQGMVPVQWDCDSVDYRDPAPDEMRRRILDKARNGSIMLFHSGAKNTPAALPGILEDLKGAGYEIVPVSELILPEPYIIDHEGRQHRAS